MKKETKTPETYIQMLQQELRMLTSHNEAVLAYVRLLNAQVSGNTHRITELQHKLAKARGIENDT